jgi:hypothetical protein
MMRIQPSPLQESERSGKQFPVPAHVLTGAMTKPGAARSHNCSALLMTATAKAAIVGLAACNHSRKRTEQG